MAKYFKDSEFVCSCCGKLPKGGMHPKILKILDAIREELKQPVHINCGYRCPGHNAKTPNASPNSQHMFGTAVDVSAKGIGVEKLAKLGEKYGADGIGRYFRQSFVHLDVRGYKARWEE